MYNYKAIALSGPPVSGKSTLARELVRKYGFSLYSVGQVWRDKWKTTHPLGDVSFEDYWKKASEQLTTIEKRNIDSSVKKMCEKGNVVVDSRFAAIYGGDIGLRVLITAPFKARLSRATKRESYGLYSAEDIEKILVHREDEEVTLGKSLYGKDYRDSAYYHIVLNSDLLTIEEELTVIETLMGSPK